MNVVSFSGGKDSTAMLFKMLEKGIKIGKIINFDCETWEWQQLQEHIKKVQSSIPIEIIRIKNKTSFEQLMLHGGKGEIRKGLGFPMWKRRWCTHRKIQKLKTLYKREDTVYIGFSYDEHKRLNRNIPPYSKVVYPLIEWKMTQEDNLKYCNSLGFNWGGLYKILNRVSCWCCPYQPLRDIEILFKHFPLKWNKLKEWESKTWNNFHSRFSLKELELKFTSDSELEKKLDNEGRKLLYLRKAVETDDNIKIFRSKRVRKKFGIGWVYFTMNNKQYKRVYTVPFDPKTPSQLEKRQKFANAVAAWQALTPAQKRLWNQDAKYKNLHMTGYNLFISTQLNL